MAILERGETLLRVEYVAERWKLPRRTVLALTRGEGLGLLPAGLQIWQEGNTTALGRCDTRGVGGSE